MSFSNRQLLQHTAHRPYPMPDGRWQYYQEWLDALFLHWEVPLETIQKLLPESLQADHFDGRYYVSLVAFTMSNVHPRGLFPLKFISDFHEINLRTYVICDNKPGVYFLSIEAEKELAVLLARYLSGLPYQKATIIRKPGIYRSDNHDKKLHLDTTFRPGSPLKQKNELDIWLTERYCLYLDKNGLLCRYDIHHIEWPLKTLTTDFLHIDYSAGDLTLTNETLYQAHYSPGVQVLTWPRQHADPDR